MAKRQQKQVEYFSGAHGEEPFRQWLEMLPKLDRGRIKVRVKKIERNDFGDHKELRNADKVWELRFDFGPDYRVYYGEVEDEDLVIILTGGDKVTQTQDIENSQGTMEILEGE